MNEAVYSSIKQYNYIKKTWCNLHRSSRRKTVNNLNSPIKGYTFIFLAAILWGNIGPFSKLAFSQGITPMEMAFWRAVIAWFFFAVHAAAIKEVAIQKKHITLLSIFSLTGVTFFYSSYQIAVSRGGAALAAVLLYTGPLWVCVISRFTFKEAITPMKTAALAMTVSGVLMVSLGQTGPAGISIDLIAVAAGLASGFFYSLYYIIGKYFTGTYSSPNLFLYILLPGAAAMLPFVQFHHKNTAAWAAIIAVAFFSTYIAFYCYYRGLQYLEASKASIAATIEPVVAAAVAFFWWGEIFAPMGYGGAALIILAEILVILDDLAKRTDRP